MSGVPGLGYVGTRTSSAHAVLSGGPHRRPHRSAGAWTSSSPRPEFSYGDDVLSGRTACPLSSWATVSAGTDRSCRQAHARTDGCSALL